MIKQDRSIGMYILLSFVTCGVYSWYFIYSVAMDMNTVCYGDGEETTGLGMFILLSIVTCGIYSWIWYYKLANRQQQNAGRYGFTIQENGTSVLLWMLLGSLLCGVGFFVGIYIIIKNMNMLAVAYNTHKFGGNQYQNGNNYAQQNGQNGNNYAQPNNKNNNVNVANSGNQAVNQVFLKCKKGEFAGSSFPVKINENVVIGRDLTCNIKLDSQTPRISRKHCIFTYDGKMWIMDNGSSFGTFLMNGVRLDPMNKVELQPGMGFYLGNQDVIFYV